MIKGGKFLKKLLCYFLGEYNKITLNLSTELIM